jgi:hypothetical protein
MAPVLFLFLMHNAQTVPGNGITSTWVGMGVELLHSTCCGGTYLALAWLLRGDSATTTSQYNYLYLEGIQNVRPNVYN